VEEEEGSGQMHSMSAAPSLFGHGKLIIIQLLNTKHLYVCMKADDIRRYYAVCFSFVSCHVFNVALKKGQSLVMERGMR
jgi:hypothetical protein